MRSYSTRLRQALISWNQFCLTHESLVRQQIIAVVSSNKQYKHAIFLQLKSVSLNQKNKRRDRLRVLLKAWKDGIAYYQYMVSQNFQAFQIRKDSQNRLKASIFDVLRLNKEQEKFCFMNQQWEGKTQPEIKLLQEQILQKSTKALQRRKLRGLKCLARYACAGVSGYFQKWKRNFFIRKFKGANFIRALMLRHYRKSIHAAVSHWKKGTLFKNLYDCQKYVDEQEMNIEQVQNRLYTLTELVNVEQIRQWNIRRQGMQSAVNVFNKRMYSYGVKRWRRGCLFYRTLQFKGQTLIDRKRKILCKSAWLIYVRQVQMYHQDRRADNRAQYYLGIRNERLIRRCFNAVLQFQSTFRRSKRYWKIVLTNLDMWLKRRALVQWCDRKNTAIESELRAKQSQNTIAYDIINEILGKNVKTLTEASNLNVKLEKDLKVQGQRVLSNIFARYYYIKAERGIKKWKDKVLFERHRESFFMSIMRHQKKSQFYVVKSAFKNWISKKEIKNIQVQIKQIEYDGQQAGQLKQYQLQVHIQEALKLERHIANDASITINYIEKFNKTISIIIRKNLEFNYQSKLRFIFQQWSNFVKRQKSFIRSVTNVVQKSMWQTGFSKIYQESDYNHRKQLKLRVCEGMRRMFYKKRCGLAFSILRKQLQRKIKIEIFDLQQTQLCKIRYHNNMLTKVSDVNQLRAQQLIRNRRIADIFLALKNVTKWIKSANAARLTFKETVLNYHASRALKKWHTRSVCTKKVRGLLQKIKFQQNLCIKADILKKFREKISRDRDFICKLATFAQKIDHKLIEESFHQVQLFVFSKNKTQKQNKLQGCHQIALMLNHLFKQKKSQHWSDLKRCLHLRKLKFKRIGNMFGYWYARKLRENFQRWRDQANFDLTQIDVNMDGPIVQEVLTQECRFQNCKNFMKNQGYTIFEIEQVVESTSNRAKELLSRALARMKHYKANDDFYLKPKMFDRWCSFVKLRKLVRHILRNVENKLQSVRADLSISFNRWKYSTNKQVVKLNSKDRAQLIIRCTLNGEKLLELDKIGEKLNNKISTLSLERDELIDGYVRGRRLAIVLGINNHERGVARSLSVLNDFSHSTTVDHLQNLLQKNIDLIGNLKNRVYHLEQDNIRVSQDNDDLRQTSLDGYEVGMTATSLSDDREKLSVDLADKAQVIKKLLHQNESLQMQLREQQALIEVQNLHQMQQR